MNRRKFILIICIFLFSSNLFPEDNLLIAEKPEYMAGSIWKVNMQFPVKCKEWAITETNRNGYLIIQCDQYESYLDINNDFNFVKTVNTSNEKVIAEYKPYWPGIKYPMKVGDSWHGHYQGYVASTGWHWTSTTYTKVVGIEDLRIENKDLTYKALKIEMIDNWKDKNSYSGVNYLTYWYVPSLNAVMKMENSDPRWNY